MKCAIDLWEAVVTCLTQAILNEDQAAKRKLHMLMKSTFARGKQLKEELDLQRIMNETVGLEQRTAERMIDTIKSTKKYDYSLARSEFKLAKKKLEEICTQHNMHIATSFDIDMGEIFECWYGTGNTKKMVLLEDSYVKKMSSPHTHTSSENTEKLSTDPLVMRLMVEKFNKRWSTLLCKEQKQFLSKWISGSDVQDDMKTLKETVKDEIEKYLNSNDNKLASQRLIEAKQKIESLRADCVDASNLHKWIILAGLIHELRSSDSNQKQTLLR